MANLRRSFPDATVGPLLKHIERAARRGFLRLLAGRGRARRAEVPASPTMPTPARILLIRNDRIGDAVISTPFIELLRGRFPEARIDIVLGRHNSAVAELLPEIERVHMLGATVGSLLRTVRSIRRERYDLLVNLHAKDSASAALLVAASAARVRVGFAGEAAAACNVVVPAPPAAMHIVPLTALLGAPFGIPPIVSPSAATGTATASPRLLIRIPTHRREFAERVMPSVIYEWTGPRPGCSEAAGAPVCINISGSGPEKYWGRDNFVWLARELVARGSPPIICSAPADAAERDAIAAAAGVPFIPSTGSLAEFAGCLEWASIVISPDTSVVHLAAALGKPVLELIGSARVAEVWGPWGVPSRVVGGDGTIASIPPAQVIAAFADLRAAVLASIPSSAS